MKAQYSKDMTKEDQRWVKLFQYLESKFSAIDDKFAAVDRRFDAVEGTLENLMGLRADDEVDQAVTTVQLARHDRWIKRLAQKIGLDLQT